ncbi:hypothetical protein [Streptomyces cupreus]|uniref:Membrane protein SCJ1.26 n=1 Tax=Streptomyces cupreus TaxID=2759956 RepID=A0A7X1JBI8_9ACTN|nr:hypothetical protein [Streptomyces cupreus]MBC2907620.1 hypothetical protein [Streptomyces cupreus]
MARTPGTTLRWWRWRHNVLKRRIDVVEAWLVLVMWLCAASGGVLAGLVAGTASAESLERQRIERQEVPAVLLQDAEPRAKGRMGSPPVWATVRWTGADGSRHTGQTRVKPGTEAGTRITVWVDTPGRLTTRPLSISAGPLQATATGALAATFAVSVVLGGGQAVHWLLDRRRLRQWDEEWKRADTRWGGTTV